MEPARKLILISDGNKTFLMYLGILLKRMGLAVTNASNGMETLKLAAERRPDMIIADLELPDMRGTEVLRALKADPKLSFIPVAMMAASADKETVTICRECGCVSFMKKPVSITDLHCAIQDCIFAPSGTSRRHVRVKTNIKVYLTSNGSTNPVYTEAISEGGMFIRMKDPLPVGTGVMVEIPLGGVLELRLSGHVIYTKTLEAGSMNVSPGIAVEFAGVSGTDIERLREFVALQIADDLIDSQEEEVIDPGGYNAMKDVSNAPTRLI